MIGFANHGQPRKPDDWGALRAWGWGASRALDYLESDPAVDARKVGIEGVSRYGKAALVAAAFDSRFQMVLVGSSGEGGAKLHRRNFGEAVENLTLFLIQYFGGPALYDAKRGHPRLRMRHMPFAIDPAARDAWLRHMDAAIDAVPEMAPVAPTLRAYFINAAHFLTNQS